MLKPVVTPKNGKLRVIGYCSGSGNTLWKAYELGKSLEGTPGGSPFEVVGIFSDNPNSKAMQVAAKLGLPAKAIDIREYYKRRNTPLRDRKLRAEFDAEAVALLKEFDADVILLAGYVWATTETVLENYVVVNVHPADLALTDESGHRLLMGANGIKAAFDRDLDYLRASSHLAVMELDAGPLLVRSPKIPVDYSLHDNYDDRFRYYLKLVNEQGRLVGARAILELALGNFSVDESGNLFHKGTAVPQGLTFEQWD